MSDKKPVTKQKYTKIVESSYGSNILFDMGFGVFTALIMMFVGAFIFNLSNGLAFLLWVIPSGMFALRGLAGYLASLKVSYVKEGEESDSEPYY